MIGGESSANCKVVQPFPGLNLVPEPTGTSSAPRPSLCMIFRILILGRDFWIRVLTVQHRKIVSRFDLAQPFIKSGSLCLNRIF